MVEQVWAFFIQRTEHLKAFRRAECLSKFKAATQFPWSDQCWFHIQNQHKMEYLSRNWHSICVWGISFLLDLRWNAVKDPWFWALKGSHAGSRPQQAFHRAGTMLMWMGKGQVYFFRSTDLFQEHQLCLRAERCSRFSLLASTSPGLHFYKCTVQCYHQVCLTFLMKHNCFAKARFFFFMHV